MTMRLTSSDNAPTGSHGPARYRTTQHGTQVIVPTRCPRWVHVLSAEGYRIFETEHVLYVSCLPCADASEVDHRWSLTTNGKQTRSAEFNDDPYADLIQSILAQN